MSAIPDDWMPAASMQRIIVHWTAGNYNASNVDKRHYHLLIEGDGTVVRGVSIDCNQPPLKKGYAAHTRGCNSGSISVALCCMSKAVERPFDAGPAPMTRAQWERLIPVVATLTRRYDIPVTPQTVLSHAEVQDTLGVKQLGKWDYTRLAFDPSVVGAKACGDKLRAEVLGTEPSMPTEPPQVSWDQIGERLGAVLAKALSGLLVQMQGRNRRNTQASDAQRKRKRRKT